MKPSIMQMFGSNIWFKFTLPFKAKENQIIYVEDEYNPEINQFIEKNYNIITTLLQDKGYDFVYIPVIQKNLIDEHTGIIPNYRSDVTPESIARLKDIPPQTIYNTIFSYLKEKTFLKPGFICYQKTENDAYIFSYFEMQIISNYEFWNEIKWYIENIQTWALSRSINMRHVVPPAMHDWTIVDKSESKLQDKYSDISEFILRTIFPANRKKFSKLQITKDFRIFLTDYDNMEIKLTPLHKALYLFYLNHPEGIEFKQLRSHQEELEEIYAKLCDKGKNRDTINKTIDKLVDSTENGINTETTKTNNAFRNKDVPEDYHISGDRAGKRKIKLDGNLVRWEE